MILWSSNDLFDYLVERKTDNFENICLSLKYIKSIFDYILPEIFF